MVEINDDGQANERNVVTGKPAVLVDQVVYAPALRAAPEYSSIHANLMIGFDVTVLEKLRLLAGKTIFFCSEAGNEKIFSATASVFAGTPEIQFVRGNLTTCVEVLSQADFFTTDKSRLAEFFAVIRGIRPIFFHPCSFRVPSEENILFNSGIVIRFLGQLREIFSQDKSKNNDYYSEICKGYMV